MREKSSIIIDALVVAGLAVAIYALTVGHGFVWDDNSILLANRDLGDWSRIGQILTSNFFREAHGETPFDYWRPLVVLSHMIEHSNFGLRPAGYHAVNVLAHATASVLVLGLAGLCFSRRRIALVAGLLFAAHPVHVEVVAWISGRSDLLCGLFFAAALAADWRAGRGSAFAWRALSCAAFLAALLSKENAAVLPILVGLRAFLLAPDEPLSRRLGRGVRDIAPVALVLASWLALRYGVVGVEPPAAAPAGTDQLMLFWTWWSAFWSYGTLLVWPATLSIAHDVPIANGPWSASVVAGLAAFAGLIAAGWRQRRRAPGATYGIAIWLVTMAPLTNFAAPIGSHGRTAFPFAERFLYVPSVGFCLVAAWALAGVLPAACDSLARQTRRNARPGALVAVVCVAALVAAGAARTVARSLDWRDEATLFGVTVRQAPTSVAARSNHAAALADLAAKERDPASRASLIAKARAEYLETLSLDPANYRARLNLGNLERQAGHTARAEAIYRETLRLHPGLHQAMINLGTLLVERGALDEALTWFESAERLAPHVVEAKVDRAHVLQMLGRPDEAIPIYEEALRLEPGLRAAESGLARARAAVAER